MAVDRELARHIRNTLETEFTKDKVARVFPSGTLEAFLDRQEVFLAVRAAGVVKIDFNDETRAFLASYGAAEVRRTYQAALARYFSWCSAASLNPLCLEIHDAQSYLGSLKEDAAYDSFVSKSLVAATAFLSFMRKTHPWVRNPFPAVERPKTNRAKRPLTPPSAEDAAAILKHTSGFEGAAISAMLERGLWAVELERLELGSDGFTTKRGQQTHKGHLPQAVQIRFALAGLASPHPFAGYTAQQITFRVFRCLKELYEKGITSRRYSADDLWPFYAQTLLRQRVPVDEIQALLGMATAQTTHDYLARIAS